MSNLCKSLPATGAHGLVICLMAAFRQFHLFSRLGTEGTLADSKGDMYAASVADSKPEESDF